MSDRHIYNNSNQPWTFTIANNRSGNVNFSGAGSGQAENGPWVIPPNSVAAIEYTTDENCIKGQWQITDFQGQSKSFAYDNDQFPSPCYGDPTIKHSGNTGAANLNDPAGADISMGQDQW
jgi:hypothetical protein